MNNKKDIGQNIKDNQDKLNKKPSINAWDKLEGQLNDFQPKAKRRKLFTKWSIAASILAIVGIGAVVSNSLNSTKNNQTAMNAPIEMTFEELNHVEIPKSTKVVKESYRIAQKSVKIVEGTETKKLVPSSDVVKNTEVVLNTPKPIVAVQEQVVGLTSDVKLTDATNGTLASNDKALASNSISIDDEVVTVVKNEVVTSAKKITQTKIVVKKETVEVEKVEKPAPKPVQAKAKYVMSSSLNDFKWIMGDWREIASGNSAWSLTGNDILQNEELRISLVGDKVFLDAPFEDFAGRYTLVSQSNGHFTFVRRGVVIAITKHGKGFDVTLNDHGFEQVTMRSYMK